MKRKYTIGLIAVVVGIILVVFATRNTRASNEIVIKPKFGEFTVNVITTGELEAKSSVDILGPSGLQAAQIWQVKLDHIIDEGSLVKKGDYIARLDNSQLQEKVKSKLVDLEQSTSKYTQTRLDTALELRQARDEIINLEYAVEEKRLVVEQSTYEPPATIKQANIDLEKAERTLEQAKNNYLLKYQKAVAQMQEAASEVSSDRNRLEFLQSLMKELNIKAPEEGMVIYHRDWNGKKLTAGSQIQAWRPIVATLPDLTTMVSKTYVNEVDIRKVQSGQDVNIGLDAFPEAKLSGKVISVANVGEQKPNSDSKVFEVSIEIQGGDSTLRPSMTTSNTIVADVIDQVIYVPLECLHNQGDSLTYVIKKSGLGNIKQQVELGPSNENEVVIYQGVSLDDQVYLSEPKGLEDNEVKILGDN